MENGRVKKALAGSQLMQDSFKFFLVSLFLLLSGCSSLTKDLLKNPEVKVTQVTVQNISAESLTVGLKLNVQNPNPIPLRVDQIDYDLKISGEAVTAGKIDQKIEIPSSGSNEFVVPLTFKYNALGNILTGLIKKTLTKEYEISGKAQLGFISIPFSQKGELKIK